HRLSGVDDREQSLAPFFDLGLGGAGPFYRASLINGDGHGLPQNEEASPEGDAVVVSVRASAQVVEKVARHFDRRGEFEAAVTPFERLPHEGVVDLVKLDD